MCRKIAMNKVMALPKEERLAINPQDRGRGGCVFNGDKNNSQIKE